MKVKIHTSTYIVLLFSFLSGYFEYMYLLLLTIFIHESGHYFFSSLVGFKYKEIIIYPFGGLTLYNEDLNGYYQIFGHTMLDDEHPLITKQFACIDCQKAIIINDDGGFVEC